MVIDHLKRRRARSKSLRADSEMFRFRILGNLFGTKIRSVMYRNVKLVSGRTDYSLGSQRSRGSKLRVRVLRSTNSVGCLRKLMCTPDSVQYPFCQCAQANAMEPRSGTNLLGSDFRRRFGFAEFGYCKWRPTNRKYVVREPYVK